MKVYSKKMKSGFTLIELIVTLAILGIVLAMVFSLFLFSNRTYNKGLDQYDVQSSVRMASDLITDEIRYATEIKILDTIPQSMIDNPINEVGTYDNYIFYHNGKITRQSRYSSKTIEIGAGGNLQFSNASGDILDIEVQATDNQQVYKIESEVKPLNLNLVDGSIDTTTVLSGPVIFFRTNDDFSALQALPEATLGSNTDREEIAVNFSKGIGSAAIIFELTEPSDPLLYTINVPNINEVLLTVGSGGATAGTMVTIVVNLDEYDTGEMIDFYYTLSFDGSTWAIK